jgi:bifunctional UDP-N-acetylglucosamine pyrophosphorylase/glucosamine-1-phosphate N-acetyltransferase
VTLGRESYVAAGSAITADVPGGALGIGRGRQENKNGWVAKRKRVSSQLPAASSKGVEKV